ncbi:tetratricopeptide repeat protein [Solimonas terrae]|uniref:Tetratricopeptide repeat protein n=1 Tax=Solimonas terrae TaxID=1396819 RepID=A0A6M2BMY4_9GAMM|nr:tetratricopeptide repeat protein [Solimonas terrae]NGY03754.1 tetratricopeptide repeat protein [Solimonas terrae]
MKTWFIAVLLLPLAAFAQSAAAPSSAQLQSLLENGQVTQAVNTLENTLGDNPFDPVQLNNLAVARSRDGDVYAALELLDRAARLAPDQAVILDNRTKLREWIAARIGANKQQLDTVAVDRLPSQLPDPPPLWGE